MVATIKFSPKFITAAGQRVGVFYSVGPWVAGVDPQLIKIRPRGRRSLATLMPFFTIENDSDMMTDYFEKDSIRVLPSHPLYAEVKAAAIGGAA